MSNDFARRIQEYLEAGAAIQRAAAAACAADLARAAELVASCYRNGGKLLLCGNGGSAADCQHLASEFMNVLRHDRHRPALAAVALTTDTSFLTANANDFGYEQVFARQIEALGRPGDVLLAISTSGNSANVLRALERARALRIGTVLLTGEGGGTALGLVEVAVRVPSGDTQHVQEVHIALGHVLCGLVEEELFP